MNGPGDASGDPDAALSWDVAVQAMPYDASLDIAARRGADLAGKTVVDITNPVD